MKVDKTIKQQEEQEEVLEQEDLYQVASQSEISTVTSYIEKVFQDSPSSEQHIRNIHKLSDFLKKNNIVVAEIGAEKILQKSQKLNETLKKLYMADALVRAYQYSNIIPFIEIYCANNNVDLTKDTDEAIYGKIDKDIDLIKLYLTEIARYKLLTAEEEKELARKGTQEARNKLVEHNLRLVVSIAKRYRRYGDLPFGDLIQLGNEGVMNAARRFDAKKGCRFSTYATWWINQAIQRGIADTSRNIRVPVAVHANILKVKKAMNEYSFSHDGDLPSMEQLIEMTGLTEEKIYNAKLNMNATISLSTPLSQEKEDDTLGDMIESPENAIEEKINTMFNNDLLSRVFESGYLSQREIEILKYRNGFYGKIYTLQEISKIYHVTRERIRQMEYVALRKIRKTIQNKHLWDMDGNEIVSPAKKFFEEKEYMRKYN